MNVVYTIGHSTRSIEEFLQLLTDQQVDLLIDVRRFPRSKRHPQFNQGELAASLDDVGIDYRHIEVLGGYRDPADDSPNGGWKRSGFQGYADHLNSEEPQQAVDEIVREARMRTPALMCAEAVPWRCHRQLIADALVARDAEVRHIIDGNCINRHDLREMAVVQEDGTVIYPSREDMQGELFDAE